MTRWLYTLLMWLLLPLWMVYSWKRCQQQTDTKTCWRQLWCLDLPKLPKGCLWIHAVSLGETQVAMALIQHIRHQHPYLPIFFTGGNKSAVSLALSRAIDNMAVSFLPLDYAFLRQKLFSHLRPKLLLLIETELWPNLLLTAHAQNTPVAIIQARLSLSSRKNYPRYAQPLLRQLLAPVALLSAQTTTDKQHFIALGANTERCHTLGNLKYDLNLATDLAFHAKELQKRIGQRWIWVAGSTHPTEEIPVIDAHLDLLLTDPNALLILAPRQLSHVPKILQQLDQRACQFIQWTAWHHTNTALSKQTQILVIDTLGVLMTAYAIADVCFVGGSLVPWGGHNLLEPAALSKAIVAGPHNHNFEEIAADLLNDNAMVTVNSRSALAQQLRDWHENRQQAQDIGSRAHQCFLNKQGAMQAHLSALLPLLSDLPNDEATTSS